MGEEDIQLKILSLNCWGLPDMITAAVAKTMKREKPKRTIRIKSIGQQYVFVNN